MSEELISLEFERPITEIEKKIEVLRLSESKGLGSQEHEIQELEKQAEQLKTEIFGALNPWQRVQLARHPRRPYMMDYVRAIFTDFVELHGDRGFSDDHAMVCGLAFLDTAPVMVIGQQKGRNIQENLDRNFAMAHPEGYRKAMRVMRLAEKFKCPVITFIDTPGAYPGITAEERGQAEAIARNLFGMADLRVPVVSVVIGEGGSGGALGIGIANRVLMLENAYYSVISPEGCAAIIFHDATKASEAAEALKITANDLYALKIIDEIIKEPLGGAHRSPEETAQSIKKSLIRHLDDLSGLSGEQIAQNRYEKFRAMGIFESAKVKAVGLAPSEGEMPAVVKVKKIKKKK